jgi:RNA ligase (TIGR02306 family)
MSDLLVRVVEIDEIKPHPNADRLEIAVVGGWQVIVGKDSYEVGDVAVHIPPDAMVLQEYADEWGVTQYLSFKKNARAGRVRAARLRGETSFGFLVPNSLGEPAGTDLREVWEIEKYEAPAKTLGAGQVSNEHPLFHRYTNIQNLRNYPNGLDYDQPVVVTEKLHGTNSRIGWVRRDVLSVLPLEVVDLPENERRQLALESGYELVVGSHRTQRQLEEPGVYGLPLKKFDEAFRHLLRLFNRSQSIIVFGEIFGPGIQDLHYGRKEPEYRVFDIAVNGEYLDYEELRMVCVAVGLPMVPVLYSGVYTFEELCHAAEGNTSLCFGEHIREGIVVRPLAEGQWDGCRRQIFKLISPDYLCRKGGTEDH